MSSVYRKAVLAALVLFTTSLYAADTGKISGRVYSDGGSKGILGAVVYIYNGDGDIVDSCLTYPNGRFEKNVTAGDYFVSAEKGNYIREFFPDQYLLIEAGKVQVNPGQNTIISFILERGGWLGGSFDVRGEDIHDALVTAIKIDQPYGGLFKSVALEGSFPRNYAIEGLMPGIYKVLGRAAGKKTFYYPGVDNADDADPITVTENEGVPDISFLLESVGTGTVRGRVFDAETGNGLAETPVFAYQWQNYQEDPNLKITSTESDGSFTLRLAAGRYFICARCENCDTDGGNVDLYFDNQHDPERAEAIDVHDHGLISGIDFGFDFSNSYNLSIAGRVSDDQTGEGLGGVIITAIDYHSGEDISSSLSIGNGDFSIDNLASGDYLVMFSGAGVIPYFYNGSETWQNAEVIELLANYGGIQFEAITQDYGNLGLAISGRVTADSEPLGGVRIYAINVNTGRPLAFAETSASGEYSIISGLVPGSYLVVCDMIGFDSQTYPEVIDLDLLENPIVGNIDFYLERPNTSVIKNPRQPEAIEVIGNYPNPFNERTLIQIYSGRSAAISARVYAYNILGGMVGEKRITIEPGMNFIEWGLNDFGQTVSSGVYFYKIDGINSVFRMALLK